MKTLPPLSFLPGPILAAVLAGCDQSGDPEPPSIRPVVTTVVPGTSSTIRRSFSGVVDSVQGAGIAFEVGGRVIEVIAKKGVKYEENDVLARLDTAELLNQLSAAEAQLTEARQTLRRTQQLFETGNAPKSQLESAIARERSASTNYKSAEKRVNDAVLRMPYPGVIGSVNIDPQMVVGAGQTAMTIQGENGMEFDISIPAQHIHAVTKGMPSQITLGNIPGESFPARVDSVSPEISRNTTYEVTLQFDRDDDRIREGLDGEAVLELPNPAGTAVTVPLGCVAKLPHAAEFVWVVPPPNESTGISAVHRRVVKTGKLRENGTIEILSGLEPGEIVVSRGVHRLEENQEVRILDQGDWLQAN